MKRTILASSVTAIVYLGFAAPLLAAPPAATGAASQPPSSAESVTSVKSAEQCLKDLHAFESQMQKDGYWLGGSVYRDSYPMDGFGYGNSDPMMAGRTEAAGTGFQSARPAYEIRMLIASANILARHGQQQTCENVLATTRDIYKIHAADFRSSGGQMNDIPGWRRQQIAAAQPVTSKDTPYRSDELLGTDVRDPQNEALGSVDDLVMSPQTGKIAYLVIAHGGIFGIDEKYVPVPWAAFKIAPNANLLVLDTTKKALDAAPRVSNDHFAKPGQFDQESQNVDAYWTAHLPDKATTGSKN